MCFCDLFPRCASSHRVRYVHATCALCPRRRGRCMKGGRVMVHREAGRRVGLPGGALLAIGGHEEKHGDPTILREFVQLAGGGKARVVVIPTASASAETGERYEPAFAALGVADVATLEIPDRAYANGDAAL